MAVLSLPLTFNNSFWSQDYRKGLEVLFAKLEQVRPRSISSRLLSLILSSKCIQGTAENAEVLAFIRVRFIPCEHGASA